MKVIYYSQGSINPLVWGRFTNPIVRFPKDLVKGFVNMFSKTVVLQLFKIVWGSDF